VRKKTNLGGINNFQLTKHFKLSEFQCPCCQTVKLYPLLVELLEKLRKETGSAIYVNSGYRCPSHNAEVGGARFSYHRVGMAADVYSRKVSVKELGRLAHEIGFPTVIVYPHQGFIHVDVRENGLGLVGG